MTGLGIDWSCGVRDICYYRLRRGAKTYINYIVNLKTVETEIKIRRALTESKVS